MKKKILFQSDCATSKTGFGRNSKAILSYLYKTNKYDLVQYCVSQREEDPILKRLPWKTYGTFPLEGNVPKLLENLEPQEAENRKKLFGYGEALLDSVIEKEKPDVYFAVQDIWGIDFAIDRHWFSKIDSVLWTTLDSVPILESAVKAAKKVKNFWVWSEFAERELHKMGHTHVKTYHGAIDGSKFYRKSDEEKLALREKHGINHDDFIVGFVFRNQLRKSVFSLLKGLYLFKQAYPKANVKVLLHTSWDESWDIKKFMKEFSLKDEDVLTTFVCKSCGHFKVEHPVSKIKKCPKCQKDTFITTSPSNGVDEEELNDVYNLMDVYCHPFTSGGQEMPIQEAKFTELITLVTNYSCGEDNCVKDSGSLPLKWEEYREPGTQFIKAATSSASIVDELEKVYLMSKEERKERGIISREWAYKNYSIESTCKKIEKFIDEECNKKFDYKEIITTKYPYAAIPKIEDHAAWIKTLYSRILNCEVNDDDEGLIHWVDRLNKGENRQGVENFFRNAALKEEQKKAPNKTLEFLKSIKDKKIIVIIKNGEREAFYTNCLLKNIKDTYKDFKIIVATKNELFHIFEGNDNVDHVIDYIDKMSTPFFLEGKGDEIKYCDIVIQLSDIFPNYSYIRNSEDIINFDLLCT